MTLKKSRKGPKGLPDSSLILLINMANPMKERRKIHRLTTLFKIINDDININHNNFKQAKTSRHRRGQAPEGVIPTNTSNSFFIRTTSDWNKLLGQLLSSTVNQPTANIFKTAVHQKFHQTVTSPV